MGWAASLWWVAACGHGVPTAAIRDWAKPNFSQYRKLVEDKYTEPDTRANFYGSLASLICTADTADDQGDTPACQCQHATSGSEQTEACTAFIAAYPLPE
ncbi:MAG TPA: hypothetical protein VJR89_36755 [Polyangiales bacterium]|nr:hypothetical protein [Polyangiales bacterium]